MKLRLRPLPYKHDALEPAMSPEQVRLHHEENQAGYVKLANSLAGADASDPFAWERYRFARNGAKLHELYWESYRPGGSAGHEAQCLLATKGLTIHEATAKFYEAAMSVQGSGWAAISLVLHDRSLLFHALPNHDYDWHALEPLLLLDVWEHAYAYDRWNDRASYVGAMLPLINWASFAARWEMA